jgi:hypothetical protein
VRLGDTSETAGEPPARHEQAIVERERAARARLTRGMGRGLVEGVEDPKVAPRVTLYLSPGHES